MHELKKQACLRVFRDNTVGFSIGNKGYIGTGYNSGSFTRLRDFWEWDPATDVWLQKANYVGGALQGAAGFSLNGKGYIGTGTIGANKRDFWSWDPQSNAWTQEINFGGAERWLACGFSIGNRGYISMGFFYSFNQ